MQHQQYNREILKVKGFHNIIEMLTSKGANVNLCTTNETNTPPLQICQFGHLKAALSLINHGADIIVSNKTMAERHCY